MSYARAVHGGRPIWLVLWLGMLACQDDVTVDDEPICPADHTVDVHFSYNTGSQLENRDSCELTSFGSWMSDPSQGFVSTSCGYPIELTGVSVPTIELAVGDAIVVATSVDDPFVAGGCAENGWLSIEDTQGRMQFVALSVAIDAVPLSLGDLGEVEFGVASIDGCRVLRLRAQGDEATVPSGTSTEVELAGAHLLVNLGLINVLSNDSIASCPTELYSVVMFRLPN